MVSKNNYEKYFEFIITFVGCHSEVSRVEFPRFGSVVAWPSGLRRWF